MLHSSDLLSQFAKLRLRQRHCLSTVPLLLLKLHTLSWLLLLLWLLNAHDILDSHRLHILHHPSCHSLSHVHLLGHWGLSLELIMNCFNHIAERRILVPSLDSRPLILNRDGVERSMRHRGHHVDLRRHLRKLVRQSNLNVERGW